MKKKINGFMYWGIFISSVAVMAEMLIKVPNDIVCFSKGFGLSLFIFGVFILNNDMTRLRTLKKQLLKRF